MYGDFNDADNEINYSNCFNEFELLTHDEENMDYINLYSNQKEKKNLGRKRKNCKERRNHTKFEINNMTRKLIVNFIKILLAFINNIIQIKIKNLTIKINEEELIINKIKNIRHNQKTDFTIRKINDLFNKKLEEILSEKITKKYINYPENYNQLVIKELCKDEKNQNIVSIFNSTFLECLRYFRKDDDILNDPKYSFLNGLQNYFDKFIQDLVNDEDKNNNENKYEDKEYFNKLNFLIKNMEKIYGKKKSRASRQKRD